MEKKLHVVLDMDQTLLFGCMDKQTTCDAHYGCMTQFDVVIYLRPHVQAFLKKSFSSFASVSLYSAATKSWIDEGIKAMGPICENFEMVMDKTHLRNQLKDLRILYTTEKGIELGMNETNTVLVDDCLHHGAYQPENIINIKPYHTINENDQELEKIYDQLVCIQQRICNEKVDVKDIAKIFMEPVTLIQEVDI